MFYKTFSDLLLSLKGQNCQFVKFIWACCGHYYNVRGCSIYSAFWFITVPNWLLYIFLPTMVILVVQYPDTVTTYLDLIFHNPLAFSTPELIEKTFPGSPIEVTTVIKDGVIISQKTKIVSYDYTGVIIFALSIVIILI